MFIAKTRGFYLILTRYHKSTNIIYNKNNTHIFDYLSVIPYTFINRLKKKYLYIY